MSQISQKAVNRALRKFFIDRQKKKQGGGVNHFPIYLIDNIERFDYLISLVEDDESKRLIQWFIEFRILNALLMNKDLVKEYVDPLLGLNDHARVKALAANHPASQFDASLDVDVIENWILEGYRLPGLCEAKIGDVVIDCGAFNGNSTLYFSDHVGTSGRVIAIEPDPKSYELLHRNIENYAGTFKENITSMNVAATDDKKTMSFTQGGAASRVSSTGSIKVAGVTIDSIVEGLALKEVNLLKIDVEGHEKGVLAGAADTIRRFRPKLMVCIYHLHTDFVAIPELVASHSSWYRYFVRHHATHDGELVLYCVPIRHHALRDEQG